MSTEPESFLARWSRRKREAKRVADRPEGPAGPQMPATPAAAQADTGKQTAKEVVPDGGSLSQSAPPTEAQLPSIDSLDGLRSDYQAFFQQPVAEDLRRAALKKLFADPHFNQMDMLDVYVDDYTQFEPLPAAMRMRMPSARDFLLDSERAALEAAEAKEAGTAERADPAAEASDGSMSAPTPILGAEFPDVSSDEGAAKAADLSSSPAVPPGKAPPDSAST
ncbi:MAG TPA: DUF3306 domain-containing protein [Burkholderiaceae bacterium]|nr:DUF3306 domain-containing protein [Burkholderiaceae bacterium]HQR69645.1 DUF3306 domain-containing protein [Burkholderiaceae bacterium]